MSTENSSLTSLKLTFEGEIRRLTVSASDLTYEDLVDKARSLFPRLSTFQFSWVDDEDDEIIISSGDELGEALRVMTSEKKGYLKFEVVSTSSSQEAVKPTPPLTTSSTLLSHEVPGCSSGPGHGGDQQGNPARHTAESLGHPKSSGPPTSPAVGHGHPHSRGNGSGCSWRRGQRRGHCWDRASVVQATASRAKARQRVEKAKEDSLLEDELLELCIRESLDEHNTTQSPKASHAPSFPRAPAPATAKLMARFVRDVTMPDGSEVAPCSTFTKTWRVRNDGNVDWPEGCHLMSAGGDRLVEPGMPEDYILRQPVPRACSGEEVELTLELCAPSSTGRHVGYFRLQDPQGSNFGQRLWADIRVNEADDVTASVTMSNWEMVESLREEAEVSPSTPSENDRDSILDATPLAAVEVPLDTAMDEKDPQLAQEMSRWNKELRVLSAMGFHDLEQLLPVLRLHIRVPASEQEEGQVQEQQDEAGLQAVVLALLSRQE